MSLFARSNVSSCCLFIVAVVVIMIVIVIVTIVATLVFIISIAVFLIIVTFIIVVIVVVVIISEVLIKESYVHSSTSVEVSLQWNKKKGIHSLSTFFLFFLPTKILKNFFPKTRNVRLQLRPRPRHSDPEAPVHSGGS